MDSDWNGDKGGDDNKMQRISMTSIILTQKLEKTSWSID